MGLYHCSPVPHRPHPLIPVIIFLLIVGVGVDPSHSSVVVAPLPFHCCKHLLAVVGSDVQGLARPKSPGLGSAQARLRPRLGLGRENQQITL